MTDFRAILSNRISRELSSPRPQVSRKSKDCGDHLADVLDRGGRHGHTAEGWVSGDRVA